MELFDNYCKYFFTNLVPFLLPNNSVKVQQGTQTEMAHTIFDESTHRQTLLNNAQSPMLTYFRKIFQHGQKIKTAECGSIEWYGTAGT